MNRSQVRGIGRPPDTGWSLRPAAVGHRSLAGGLAMDEVTISVGTGDRRHRLLDAFSLRAAASTVTLVVGASDRESRALLGCLAGTVRPESGSLFLCGVEVGELSDAELVGYRNEQVGVVEQAPVLLEHASALDNVAIGTSRRGFSAAASRRTATEMLDLVGLSRHVRTRVTRLTACERRRVAIARAMAANPVLLVIDEPFSTSGGIEVEETVRAVRACAASGCIVVAATGEAAFGPVADQLVEMRPMSPATMDRESSRLSLPAGTVLFGAGWRSDRVYCLDAGEVEIHGRTAGVEILRPGAVFGEIGAVVDSAREFAAVTRTEVELRTYSGEEFLRVFGLAEFRRILTKD